MTPDAKTLEGLFPATTMPDSDWWTILWSDPGLVLDKLGVEPTLDVIDLCCGDGLFTAALARKARRVLAIDIDPRLLELARARVRESDMRNCEFIEANAYRLSDVVPWPADWVLIANTFHGVPDKTRLASAVARVLKPNGRFVVVNWHRRAREETTVCERPRGPKTDLRMTPEDVAAQVEPAGFRLARLVDLPPYHYGAVFDRLDTSA
jgi:ubiquinone/menaquinone biosynthesis C-methylase UbiE